MLKPPPHYGISINAPIDYQPRRLMPGISGANKRRRSPHGHGAKKVKKLPLLPAAALLVGGSKAGSMDHGHVASRAMDSGDHRSVHYIEVSHDGDVKKDIGQSRFQHDAECKEEEEEEEQIFCKNEACGAEHVKDCLYQQLQETEEVDAEAACKARQKSELLHWGQRCQRKRGIARVKERSNPGSLRKVSKQPCQPAPEEPSCPAGLATSEKDDETASRPAGCSGPSMSGEGEGAVPTEPEQKGSWHVQENARADYAPERFLRGKGSGSAAAPDVKAVLLTLDRGEMMEDFKAIGAKLLQKPKIRRSKIAARNLQMLGLCLRLGKPSLNADMLLREYAPRLPKKKDKRGRGLRAMTSDDEDSM